MNLWKTEITESYEFTEVTLRLGCEVAQSVAGLCPPQTNCEDVAISLYIRYYIASIHFWILCQDGENCGMCVDMMMVDAKKELVVAVAGDASGKASFVSSEKVLSVFQISPSS